MRSLIGLLLAALLSFAPSLAPAQSYPSPTVSGLRFGNPAGTLFTGPGTSSSTFAVGNDGRFAAPTITGGTINGAPIGGTTPAAGTFTSVTASTPIDVASGGTGASNISGALNTAIGSTRATIAVRGASVWGGLTPSISGCTFQFDGTDTVCATVSPGTGSLRYDTGQSLTSGQQDQVRVNVGAPASSAPSSSATLAASDIDRDQYATGTITLTMPNGGAGWRSGVILNDNASSGLVTLAVPSGATLDGTTNGTTILFPFQHARVRQTGSTAYRTDWVDRSPIIVTRAVASGSAVATIDLTLPVGYSKFDVDVRDAVPAAGDGTQIRWRLTDDAFSTVKSGASDYNVQYSIGTGGSGAAASGTLAYGYLNANTLRVSSTGDVGLHSRVQVSPGGSVAAAGNNRPSMLVDSYYIQSVTPASEVIHAGFTCFAITTRANGIRFYASTGNLSGGFTVRGIP